MTPGTVRIRWRVIAASTAAGALAVAGIWMAGGKAHADPTVADAVCVLFEEHGVSETTTQQMIVGVSSALGITPESAAGVINSSVQSNCPQFWTSLVAVGDEFRAQQPAPEEPTPVRGHMNYAV